MTVNINNIALGNETNTNQVMTIERKLYNEPDSEYVVVSNNVLVGIDGSTTLSIPGLSSGARYHIRASNNCTEPKVYYVQSINL